MENMDSSSSDSDSLSAEGWLDLSKSDYAKVIFSTLYWNPESGEVGCHFKVTETVSRNPLDYIGLYKVGYENLSQCLATKHINQIEFETDAKLIHCNFKTEELPELNGFYQFLYVTHDKEVSGASMPFAVNSKSTTFSSDYSDDDVVAAEKVEDDFLMVCHGLERKNKKLEKVICEKRSENVCLSKMCDEFQLEIDSLRRTQDKITTELSKSKGRCTELFSELEVAKRQKVECSNELQSHKIFIDALLRDLDSAKSKENTFSSELKDVKAENKALKLQLAIANAKETELCTDLEDEKTVKNGLYLQLRSIEAERKAHALELETTKNKLKTISDNLDCLQIVYESIRNENENFTGDLTDLTCKDVISFLIEKLEDISKTYRLTTELEASGRACKKLSVELENCKKVLADYSSSKKETEAQHKQQIMSKQLSTLEHTSQLMKAQLDEAEQYKQIAEKEISELKKNLEMRTQLSNAFRVGTTSNEHHLLLTELADAKYMIQAMKDSKQLAMNEMDELRQKLAKVKDELAKVKCENILLHLHHQEDSSEQDDKLSEVDSLKKYSADLEERLEKELVFKENLKSSMKELFPSLTEEEIEMGLENLVPNIKLQREEIDQKLLEMESSKKYTADLEEKLEKEFVYKKVLKLSIKELYPSLTEAQLEMELYNLVQNIKSQQEEIDQKLSEIESLKQHSADLEEKIEKEVAFKKNIKLSMKEIFPTLTEAQLEMELHNLGPKIKFQHEEINEKFSEMCVLEKNIRDLGNELKQEVILKQNFRTLLEKHFPKLNDDQLVIKLENVLQDADCQRQELKQKFHEIQSLKEHIADLEEGLKKEVVHKQNLYSKLKGCFSNLEDNEFEAQLESVFPKIEGQLKELQQLKEECREKDIVMEQLNEEMKKLKESESTALEEVKDLTARLMDAAELYKELYVGKQKYLKKLKKIIPSKQQAALSKSLGNSSFEEHMAKLNALPMNIDTLKESTSSNNDSDTGEHVPPEMFPLQDGSFTRLEKSSTASNFMTSSHNATVFNETPTLSCNNVQGNTSASVVSQLPESSSVEDSVSCSICGIFFSVTVLLQHYEMVHKVDVCPMCSQLFDKSFPPQYFVYHVNEHFEKE